MYGYVGVAFDKDSNKWRSSIRVHNKLYNLGRYIKKKGAVKARNNYIIKNNLQHEYRIQDYR